jgi:hypothetical protein
MTFQQLIDKYGRDGDIETMEHLTHKVDHFVEEVREKHPEMVEHFLIKVDLLLNPYFSKESSKYAVSKLKNKDGTTGEHWNKETTDRVLEAKGYDFNYCDWYYVLNMIYSDYYKSGRSDDTYIELAYDFLEDKDAPEDKAKRYYKAMLTS